MKVIEYKPPVLTHVVLRIGVKTANGWTVKRSHTIRVWYHAYIDSKSNTLTLNERMRWVDNRNIAAGLKPAPVLKLKHPR